MAASAGMTSTGSSSTASTSVAAQAAFAEEATQVFQPRQAEDAPHVLLAEAGTGVGKTLGYLAPASLWAEANGPAVWVSTFSS